MLELEWTEFRQLSGSLLLHPQYQLIIKHPGTQMFLRAGLNEEPTHLGQLHNSEPASGAAGC